MNDRGEHPGFELGIGMGGTLPMGEYAAWGRRIEEAGFASITVFGDLAQQPPIGPLLQIANATSSLRLGFGALNPFTVHPIEIAGQIAILDDAAQGRAYLGLARGTWLDKVGVSTRGAVAAVQDTIAICQQLLAGDDSGYAGRAFRMDKGVRLMYPVHRATVPIMVGTWSPRLAAVAGASAQEVKVGGSANPTFVGVIRERVAAGAVAAGVDPRGCDLVFGAVTCVDEDRRAARRAVCQHAAVYMDAIASLDPTVSIDPDLTLRVRERLDAGDQQGAGELIPEDLLRRFSFFGTPEDVAGQLSALRDAGVKRVEFGPPFGIDRWRGVELLSERVRPLVGI